MMTRTEIRDWLLAYAWSGSPEDQEAEVDCILAQDGWQHLTAVSEHYAGQAAEPGPAAASDAQDYALSALYEAHDGPHQPTCPAWDGADRPDAEDLADVAADRAWQEFKDSDDYRPAR